MTIDQSTTRKSQFDPTLVSIITPAYRAAAFIGETIASVRAQDYPHWEMLIVDDCSPDDTVACVESVATIEPRVRLLQQVSNAGPAAARTAALRTAAGRYVAFLDSDDLWLPNKLSAQVRFMQVRDAAVCYTQFRRINQDGGKIGRLISIPKSLTYSGLLCNTAIVTSSAMVDRQRTGPFLMPDAPYDDYALWLSLLKAGHPALGLAQDLVRYRVVSDSVSRSKHVSAARVWRTYREIESLGLLRSAWSFTNYAVRGWLKYQTF